MLDGSGDELRPVVRADEARLAPSTEQRCEGFYHILGGDRALDVYAQALPGVLIHHWHHLQTSALLGQVHNEVVTPHVVFVLSPPLRAPVLGLAQDREVLPFVLLLGYFESFLSPQPMHPLLVEQPTFSPQQCPHLTVAVAGILPRELYHPLGQPAIPLRLAAHVALARSGLADHPARPTLGDPQLLPNVLDGGLPPGLNLRSFPCSPPLGCLCPVPVRQPTSSGGHSLSPAP